MKQRCVSAGLWSVAVDGKGPSLILAYFYIGNFRKSADRIGIIFDPSKLQNRSFLWKIYIRCNYSFSILVSEYVDIFGYVQFGGILVTPVIGLVFDKDRLTGKDKEIMMMSAQAQRIKKLSDCIAPFAVTNILCMIFFNP